MTQGTHRLTVQVLKEDGCWVGLPAGVAGGTTGDTLAELFYEIEAVKHFCVGVPKETPVSVEYVYELPEVGEDILGAYRDLSTRLEDVAKAAVSRLMQAGVSVLDSAALLGISPSRVDQLMHSA